MVKNKTKMIFAAIGVLFLCTSLVMAQDAIVTDSVLVKDADSIVDVSELDERVDAGILSVYENTASLESNRQPSKIVVRPNVLSFIHPEYGYEPGQEWAPRYYYIKTPDKVKNEEMYRYDLKGYSYGIGKPLAFTWVGYLYANSDGILQASATENAGNNIPVSQFIGSDGHLYLKFGPVSQYYNSFVLSYQSGSTGERIDHSAGEYKVFVYIKDLQL